jgi:NAD(P)-dependent dehydrogenase (short-subunit alcohol dehydrogenase family)
VSVALISGASTGIGRATTLRLAGSGWTVLAGVRDPKVGEGLVAEGGARVIPVILDVTDAEQIAQAAELVEKHAGAAGLDALVNNAGIGMGGPLELTPLDDLRRQFEVNLFGHVAVMQVMLPALRRAHGRIVLVSSVGGRVTTPFTAPYAASKSALEAVGDALRVELHSSEVQVTLIEPGSVATPIWDKSRADVEAVSIPPEFDELYGRAIPAMAKVLEDTARRGIPPEKVAETIERALNAKRMQARYLIGRDAHAMVWAKRLLPDLAFDRVLRRALKI